jgi:serine protease Do
MPTRIALLIVLMIACCTIRAKADDNADRAAKRAARRTPVVRVFEQCRDAVVNISTTRLVRMRSLGYGGMFDDIFDFGTRARNRRVQSVGSGVVVHESGYIVTNAHVVSQASDIQVNFADESTRDATVVAVDQEHDLAVLKVDAPQPLPFQRLGRSDDIMIGETVVAVGNPLGLQHTVTTGIVSALGRDLEFSRDLVYRGLIQTDAPINPGNSGGPLLNINTELIGINTAIRGDAQNIGFAIPVDRVWELLPSLLDIERRQRVRFGLRVSGAKAEVSDVRAESPAADADLEKGDRVVAFNGEPIRDAIDYYVHLLDQDPNSVVALRVERDKKQHDVKVPLQSIPIPDGGLLAFRHLGMELEEVSDDMRRRYDLPDYASLIVVGLRRGGAAAEAGIEPTDLILRIDRVPVTSLDEVGLILEGTRPRMRVVVEGLRLDPRRPFLWSAVLRAN